ncbi:jouberin [Pristis pectinata]|uniref:jouberin n=1 Tax=Pristis pectinata TaxID=685728 RepID=UPI00223E4712|nr:jouberin [Pristis pectinata]
MRPRWNRSQAIEAAASPDWRPFHAGESEAKAKTKAQFEEAFKSYSGLAADKKKSKKKSVPSQESIVLETLRNKLGLHKDNEDETILNNTYNPEEHSPRFSKNKLNARISVAEKVNNNELQEDEKPHKQNKKKKKKSSINEESFDGEHLQKGPCPESVMPVQKSEKKKLKEESLANSVLRSNLADDVDSLIKAYQQQIAARDAGDGKKTRQKIMERSLETISRVSSILTSKLEKKKKPLLTNEGETSEMHISELQDNQDEANHSRKKIPHRRLIPELEEISDEGKQNQGEKEIQQKTKRKKTKKTKVEKIEMEEEVHEPPEREEAASTVAAELQQSKPKYITDDDLVLGVNIHRSDLLKTDFMTSHPSVKVHVINEETGQYVRKEHSNRHVTSYYEQDNVEHILPIMTQPYDFRKNKSTIPVWEEQLVFNERFGYFLKDSIGSPNTLLFFEILEFVSMDEAKVNFATQSSEGGWRKLAWAFLKLVGANGVLNIDGKLRLQLYYPASKVKKLSNSIEVFEWWKKRPWDHYPSTLYVTVKGLRLPQNVNPSVRSMMVFQQEQGTISYNELQSELTRASVSSNLDIEKLELLKWTRLPGQVCRIPNQLLLSFRGGHIGCFFIAFSHDGRSLAASCADRNGHFIVVYEIPSGHPLGEFNGHFNIVYSLCWSNNDKTLLSASSDGTVRVWNTETYQNPAEKMLPHPSFIYTAKYHPFAQYLVVTGGYDCIIRVWNINVNEMNGQLLQELDGHKSFINTLCFDAEGLRMFSGDSSGLIIVWSTFVNEGVLENPVRQWSIDKNILQNDLKGIPINHLEVHPNGRRLLIHARDSTLRVMDLRVLAAKKYTGATNYREHIYSTFTPCGTFLFSGSEDGICYVWNTDTGDQVAMYSDLNYTSAVRCVAFHPHEHMVTFCAFGPNQPILVFLYDQQVAQMEAESMKNVCRANLKSATTATPKGPKILSSSFDGRTVCDASLSSFSHSSRMSMKMQKVREKLNSVLESVQQNTSEMDHYLVQQDMVPMMSLDTRWNSSFNSMRNCYLNSARPKHSLPAPSLLSPHSKLRLPTTVGAQLLSQQPPVSQIANEAIHACIQQTQTTNEDSVPVGHRFSRPPSVKLETTNANPSISSIKVEADSNAPVEETVVALYDYTAHRSDELTIQHYDIIQVLYKDNVNWWFGRLANGTQGYFPANYVANERIREEIQPHQQDNNPLLVTEDEEAEVKSPTPTKMSAVISKSGELKLISEHDTDTESPVKPASQKKRKKKLAAKPLDVTTPKSDLMVAEGDCKIDAMTARKKKKKKSLRNQSTNGESNGAFKMD